MTSSQSIAQVTSDGTVNTQVTQNGDTAEITGGETRGSNLFHSFQDFSVPANNEAFFNNANDVSNIFSRVTGGNISNIDGVIRANGSASLFLINPAGIVFGEGSSLNIGGSFYGSTASSILFEDGEFSASDLENSPLLTVNVPIGLGFRDEPGDIVNRSVTDDLGLKVLSGKNINLLGGNLNLTGGKITAPGGIINLGGLSTAGTINIERDGDFRFPNNVAKANIFLTDNAVVNVISDGGGLITANANNLELIGESQFLAGIGAGLGSENSLAGIIQINATRIFANNNSEIRADNLGIGRGGIININTNTLDFDNNSAIVASTFGQGDAGIVNITAQDISFEQEWGGIYNTVGLTRIATDDPVTEGVLGNGGNININTGTLELTDAARISVNSVAQGNAGNININATGEVSFSGKGVTFVPAFDGRVLSGASSQVQFEGVGNSGQVNIEASSLNLSDSGSIFVDISGVEGDAGDITLNIQNNIFLDQGALIFAQVQEDATGDGGDINITANSYESKGGSSILADTEGMGDGGNINIDIEETISLNEDSAIQTGTGENAIGDAGNIKIKANSLSLDFSAGILAQTKGQGNAGDISITTNEDISLGNESKINSLVTPSATGNGADISITAGELNLTNKSTINANTEGQSSNQNIISNAGDININIAGDINLDNDQENISPDNGNQIQSQVGEGAIGNAGNIKINAGGSLISNNGNQILTGSEGIGNGGDIQITVAESIKIRDSSLIFANIGEQSRGNAGNIILNARKTFSLSDSLVISQIQNEAQGNSGEIDITANTIDINDFSLVSTNIKRGASGTAGNINLNGDNISINSGAFIDALTENGFDGGNINLSGNNLEIASGGAITTSTDSVGNAGNINLNLTGDITINGDVATLQPEDFPNREQILLDLQGSTGLFATSSSTSTGNGGNIEVINSGDLSISNNGQISVDSQGEGNGGILTINTDFLNLDNQAAISAITTSGTGGNIYLVAKDEIHLENNSIISTQAFGSGNGNGGNIDIDTNFIFAFPNENNDILASAKQGNGGNITINTEYLFGIQERTPNDLNNDISASSELGINGTVTFNTPEVDPTSGIFELPDIPIDAAAILAKDICKFEDEKIAGGSSFIITGRGGLTPTSEGFTENRDRIVNWISREDLEVSSNGAVGIRQRKEQETIYETYSEIKQSQGLVVAADGSTWLTANASNTVLQGAKNVHPECQTVPN